MARKRLLSTTVPAANTYTTTQVNLASGQYLLVFSKFDYGSGGTSIKVYTQVSLDGGNTWADVVNHAFATSDAAKVSKVSTSASLAAATVPTDGSLADDTVKDGLFGDLVRLKYVVAGTYAASTLEVWAQIR